MKSSAILKAQRRLVTAKRQYRALKSAANFRQKDDFSEAWYLFLVCWKGIYTILEEGAKGNAKSMQWYGGEARFRRNDPLLQYLYEARNDAEHGLEYEIGNDQIEVIFDLPDSHVQQDRYIDVRSVMTPTGPKLVASRPDGGPISIHAVNNSGFQLRKVLARGNRIIHPPMHHMGKPLIDISPIGVARLAIAYIEGLVRESAATQAPSSGTPS